MATGPASLPRFEDRLLYHLVAMTGNRPADLASGVSESDLAVRLAGEIEVTASQAFRADFARSEPGRRILVAVEALEGEGFVEAMKDVHPWTIWPTTEGRWEVAQWESRWERDRRERDEGIQAAILHALHGRPPDQPLDVEAFCSAQGIEGPEFEPSARRLLEQGRVEELEGAPGGLGEGYLRLTEAGAATVEGLATMQSATADDPAVEVERLGRRLRAAEQALSTEISDEELRRRCLPLLQTEPPYDRMIRTACFIMEMRMRHAAGAGPDHSPAELVEAVFGPEGPIALGPTAAEQRGAQDLFRGVLELFRTGREGGLARSFSHQDALRFLGMIDLLLGLLSRRVRGSATSGDGGSPA